jgi:hypothetical protein
LDILKIAGFLNSEGKCTDDCSEEMLEFYWMVHPAQYADRCRMPALPYPIKNEKDAFNCWDKYVVQYVLELSMEGPISPDKEKTRP